MAKKPSKGERGMPAGASKKAMDVDKKSDKLLRVKEGSPFDKAKDKYIAKTFKGKGK